MLERLSGFGRTATESVAVSFGPLEALQGKDWIARGSGLSYGDSALVHNGWVRRVPPATPRLVTHMRHGALVEVSAGTTIGELMRWLAPFGLELYVVPGSSYVTIGGAVAADIHGKNQHRVGTFGRYVHKLTLANPGEKPIEVHSTDESRAAIIGAMGLTGLITDVVLETRKSSGTHVVVERQTGASSERLLEHLQTIQMNYEYVVAWVDWTPLLTKGVTRWVIDAANDAGPTASPWKDRSLQFSVPAVSLPIAPPLVRAANETLFRVARRGKSFTKHKSQYFFPLDRIRNWNCFVGRNGFYEYQFVVPQESAATTMVEIESILKRLRLAPFFSGAKIFGSDFQSIGYMSFPTPGLTVAMDFFADDPQALEAMNAIDEVILAAKGRVYLAKDSRLNGSVFKNMYPQFTYVQEFRRNLSNPPVSCMSNRLGIE